MTALIVSYVHDTFHDLPGEYREAFLAWMAGQGVDVKLARGIAVYGGDAPYAEVEMYTCDDNGRKVVDEAREEFVTHVETVTLSSLPPAREV